MTTAATAMAPGQLIGRGRTADVHVWGVGQVLKLFHEGCPEELVRHEAAVQWAIAWTGAPAPQLVGGVTIGPRHGLVYERVDGPSMLDQCVARPWRVRRLARTLAALHAAIHDRGGDGLPTARSALRQAIARAPLLPSWMRAKTLDLLDALPDGSALCHFDFHPGQVLMSARGPVVIDWMTAVRGEPMADVARTALLLRIGRPTDARGRHIALTDGWRRVFREVYLRRYFALRPTASRKQLGAWLAPIAAARLAEAVEGEREPLLALLERALARAQPQQISSTDSAAGGGSVAAAGGAEAASRSSTR